MAKLKIAGIWKGDLEVELEQWTIPKLREEVAKQSGLSPETINLICAGKVLKDGDGSEKLSQLGVKNNAKILATRVSVDEGKSLVAEEERSRRLTRVKAAAAALVERQADGSVPVEDFGIELEDQNGEKIRFGSETDRWAMMMGLMLHANAKKLIRRQLYFYHLRFINREGIDFSDAQGMQAIQEWELAENLQGVLRVPDKIFQISKCSKYHIAFP